MPAPPPSITVVRLPWDGREPPVRRVLAAVARDPHGGLALSDALHRPDTAASVTWRPYAVARYPGALHVVCFRDDVAGAVLRGEPSALPVRRVSAASLAEPGAEGPSVRLAFTSPSLFRVAGLDHLLPDPFHVFGGLLARWRSYGYPELPEPVWKRIPCWPERLAYESLAKAHGQARRGFVGCVRYETLPQAPDGQAALWTLARFAQYAGVGQGTTYGFGRALVLPPGLRWDQAVAGRLSAWDRPRSMPPPPPPAPAH